MGFAGIAVGAAMVSINTRGIILHLYEILSCILNVCIPLEKVTVQMLNILDHKKMFSFVLL